jgi:pyrophosphatase PpaX
VARYSVVLFDLDGTLIDSIGLIVDSFHHALAAHGLPRQTDATWLRTIGTPLRAAFAPFAASDAAQDEMVRVYREHNLANHDARVRAYPGVLDCVRALRAAGVALAVVTSKSRAGTLRGLRVAGLEGEFSALVCLDDVTNAKPHREPCDRALALLGARPAEALFVGDSVHDMHAGRAAEVPTGAALWGPFDREHLAPSAPTHWLKSPGAVLDVVLG